MANLTNKELIGLSDQLDFEKVLHCKYLAAAESSADPQLQTQYRTLADQHKENYTCLLKHLN